MLRSISELENNIEKMTEQLKYTVFLEDLSNSLIQKEKNKDSPLSQFKFNIAVAFLRAINGKNDELDTLIPIKRNIENLCKFNNNIEIDEEIEKYTKQFSINEIIHENVLLLKFYDQD